MGDLAQSILKTLAFFDAQDLPLTLVEMRSYLVMNNSPSPSLTLREGTPPLKVRGGGEGLLLSEINRVLITELKDKVSYQKGFYFLAGRDDLVNLRDRNYRVSLRRMRKAKKFLYFLRFIPFVRAVSISGSTSLLNSTADSDIDLLVITAKNRIWLARMLVSLYFHLLGQRRHHVYTKNRFCLNHYLVQGVVIGHDQNLYTAIEYASLLPVLGEKEIIGFISQNQWLLDYVSQQVGEQRLPFFGFGQGLLQQVWEFLLELTLLAPVLNWAAKLYQKNRIRPQAGVSYSDQELSFHPESKGQQILARFHLTKANFGL